jgi:hypothetical protein
MEHLWIEAFLCGLLVFCEVRNYLERKSLLDRIMSKDYQEYALVDVERRKASVRPVAPQERTIPI